MSNKTSLETDPCSHENWHKRPSGGERKELKTKPITFPCISADYKPRMRIFPDEFWLSRPILFLRLRPQVPVCSSAAEERWSHRICNGFSSGWFVWLWELCTIYAVFPELWRKLLNIHSDVSPAIPRVGIPNEKPHEITYYCLFFKKLALDFFISETDLVTIGWVIVRSLHFLKTCLFLEMQSVIQASVIWVYAVNYSLLLFGAVWILLKPGCFRYSKTGTSTKLLQHLLLPIMTSESDLLATIGTLSGTYSLCTDWIYYVTPQGTIPKVQSSIYLLANPKIQGQ